MDGVSTFRMVVTMCIILLSVSVLVALGENFLSSELPALASLPIALVLVPALATSYYHRKIDVEFSKQQKKRISAWYTALNALLGVPGVIVAAKEKRNLDAEGIIATILIVLLLLVICYRVVYWQLGENYVNDQP